MSVELLDDLTPAERDIVLLAGQDIDRAAIARRRGVKPSTLKKQVQSVLQKTGARSLAHLALRVTHAELAAIRSPDAAPKPRKGTDIMERTYDHNASIIYVDPKGVRHAAIVTSWWGAPGASYDGPVFGNPPASAPDGYVSPTGEPGCNLVFVDEDAMKKDPYGRQISRATSVVHKSKQPAHGNFWCWPDEA